MKGEQAEIKFALTRTNGEQLVLVRFAAGDYGILEFEADSALSEDELTPKQIFTMDEALRLAAWLLETPERQLTQNERAMLAASLVLAARENSRLTKASCAGFIRVQP